MTREKGKNQRETDRKLYKEHERKRAGCKHVFLQLSHLGLEKKKYKAAGDFKTE